MSNLRTIDLFVKFVGTVNSFNIISGFFEWDLFYKGIQRFIVPAVEPFTHVMRSSIVASCSINQFRFELVG